MTRATNEDAFICDGNSEGCHNILEVPRLPLREARAWAEREKDWTTADGNDYCPECSALLEDSRQHPVTRGGGNSGGTMPSPFPKVPEDLTEEEGAD